MLYDDYDIRMYTINIYFYQSRLCLYIYSITYKELINRFQNFQKFPEVLLHLYQHYAQ